MATSSKPAVLPLAAEGKSKDLYAILEVDRSVGVEALRAAYRRAVRRAHPDKGGSAEAFLAVARAFEILSNPASRSSYDQELATPRVAKRCRDDEIRGSSARRKRSQEEYRLQESLSRLREVLQSMELCSRKRGISTLPMDIKTHLAQFMADATPTDAVHTAVDGRTALSSSLRLRAMSVKGCKKYSAQMDLDCLRSYTRHVAFDVALEQQLILSDLRDKLFMADEVDPSIWAPPFKVCEIIRHVLAAHGTCEKQLGLSVFVQLRASEWVANRYSLTSPVMCFAKAVKLRWRLKSARTWPELREEWLQLLQSGRRRLDEAAAVQLVDAARRQFLQQKFQKAVTKVSQALDVQTRTKMPKISEPPQALGWAALASRWMLVEQK
ncbi:DnaJ protein homolog (DNAJ-1) [Durusdinium trenchii]|uniref:DnaJ protein homolog (DNAJ-1) n=1 Tax=Durusdinium trenchii TaxID=1381693 RepID=A0ABP0JFQ6_9DINO